MFAIAICIAFVASAFVVGNQNPDPEKIRLLNVALMYLKTLE